MQGLARFLPHLLVLALGIATLIRAGRLEASGRLVEARRTARTAGWLGAIGATVAAAGAMLLPAWQGAVALTMLAAGFVALLAGLAGKPRPTCWAALGLLLAGVVVALASVR